MNYNDPIILEDESSPLATLFSDAQVFLGYINSSENPSRGLIFVREAFGKQWIYACSETRAYEFATDRTLLLWAAEVADKLNYSDSMISRIADRLQDSLDALVRMKPARLQSFVERTERLMREAGIRSISMNGTVVAD